MGAVVVWASALLPVASAAAADPAGILGYLDPRTGTFRVANLANSADPGGMSAVSGTFKLTLNIHAITPVNAVSCSLQVSAFSSTGPIEETAGTSNSVSGGTTTCDISLPYSWRNPIASASMPIAVSYTIIGDTGQRLSLQGVASLTKVPANGGTTSYTIATTI